MQHTIEVQKYAQCYGSFDNYLIHFEIIGVGRSMGASGGRSAIGGARSQAHALPLQEHLMLLISNRQYQMSG